MGFSLSALLSQLWPLAVASAVIFYFASRGAKQRRDAQVALNTADAREHDMGYAAPSSDEVGGVVEGTRHFSGTTRGVPWMAEVANLASEVDDGLATRRRTSLSYTRWTATECRPGLGTLLLMTLPPGVPVPPVPANAAGGFLSGLASKAAWAALQVYIRGNFGNARADALALAPEQRLPLPSDDFGSTFVAFADRPELLQPFTPAARDWLLSGRDDRAAFLWDAEGLTLTWQRAHVTPEAVARLAEYGAELVSRLGASHHD